MSKARELGTYAGKILQVKSTIKTDTFTTTSGSVTDITGLNVSITPASTSNKVLVIARVNIGLDRTAPYLYPLFLYRDSTSIGAHDSASNRTRAHSGGQWPCAATDPTVDYVLEFLDSPSSTSELTYSVQGRNAYNPNTTALVVNSTQNDGDASYNSRVISTITAMEIAG